MRVGDLVLWEKVQNDKTDLIEKEYGVVIKMSKTGHTTESAQVLFTDGSVCWVDTRVLEVANEGR